MMRQPLLGRSLALAVLVALGCSSGSGGGGPGDAGSSGSGGVTAVGGSSGSGGLTVTGGTGGAAGGSAGASGGTAGAAGAATGGAPPMCASASECGAADVSYPGNPDPATSVATECAGGRCGVVTHYNGNYDSPKTPKSCAEICATSTYEGQPMTCAPSCTIAVINGFGDQGLFFGDGVDGGVGAGTVGGLATFQFSPLSGAYQDEEVSCSEVPPKKLIKGSNSYTYVSHRCCCVAP